MNAKPDALRALEVTETAIGDVVALFSAYLDNDVVAERRETGRIVERRPGESSDEALARIKRTVGLSGLLGSTFLGLAGGLIGDESLDSRTLLQRYALRLTSGHERRRAIACRCAPATDEAPRCPFCGCPKSRELALPNVVVGRCSDVECVCHTYEESG